MYSGVPRLIIAFYIGLIITIELGNFMDEYKNAGLGTLRMNG